MRRRSVRPSFLLSAGLCALLGGCFQSCFTYGVLQGPPQAERYYKQGMGFLADGQPARAIERFELTLEIEPMHIPAKAHLGYACYKLGRHDRAIQELQDAIEHHPDYADSYNYMALVYEAKGDLARADEFYTKAIDTYPSYADAYYNRAQMRERQRRYEEALDDYLSAAQIAAQSNDEPSRRMLARARTAAGLIYVRNNLLDDAEKCFQIAVDTGVTIPEADFGLGRMHMRKEHWVDAIEAFHKALRVDEQEWVRQGDVEACKQALALAHKKAPNHIASKLADRAKDRYDELGAMTTSEREKKTEEVYEDVGRLLYSARKIDPRATNIFVLQGRIYLDQGEIAKAGRTVVEGLKIDKRDKDLRYMLAAVYVARARKSEKERSGSAKRDWAKAEDILRELRREAPSVLKYHNLLGIVYFAEEKLRKAEREWREALRCEGSEEEKALVAKNLEALMEKPIIKKANELNSAGVQALKHEDFGRATDLFKQALAYDPNFAVALTNLALTALEAGDLQYALSKIAEALKLDPDLHAAHIVHGRLLARQQRHKEAYEELEEAKRLNERDPEVHYQLARLMHKVGKDDRAQVHIRDAIARAPEHFPSQVLLARIHIAEGLYDQAETQLKSALLNSENKYAPAFIVLGRLYNKLGRYDEATQAAESAYHIDNYDPEAWLVLGEALESQNKDGAASGAYVKASEAYEYEGEVARALEAAERAVELAPNSSAAYGRYGILLAKAGRFDEAIRNLRIALQHDPNNLRAEFDLGTVYEELGEPALAADSYRKIIKARPAVGDAENPAHVEVFVVPRYRLGNLYQPGQEGPVSRQEAIRVLEEALEVATPAYRPALLEALQKCER